MKLVVVGLGQCGSRIADEFARLNKKARAQRGIEIVPGCFALNTDATDLSGLVHIKSDYQHRILVGGRKTGGHGVGKINELGAEIAKEDSDKLLDAIRTARRLFEADAFLVVAGTAGGTGSGAISVLTQRIKERYMDKPVYAMAILPFAHEEETEERTVYNTATCLKSLSSVADAVFLIDNQRYVRKDSSLRNNLAKINQLVVDPFYNLFCAGEEKKAKHIGAKTLDAGDIIQTLVGWTVIGYGTSPIQSAIKFPFWKSRHFREKSIETHIGIHAMDDAVSELSLRCNPADAGRALYLLSAPAREMIMDLVKELGDYMKGLAPEAVIRNGDYPEAGGTLHITVVMSELSSVEKVKSYYDRATRAIPEVQIRQAKADDKLKEIEVASKDLPSLL